MRSSVHLTALAAAISFGIQGFGVDLAHFFTTGGHAMSHLDMSHVAAGPQRTLSWWLSRLGQEISAIYITPFRMHSFASGAVSGEQFEQQRRASLFRLIAVNYTTCLLFVAVILFLVVHTSPVLRWSDVGVIVINIGCFILSFYRWTMLAIILFLLTSFLFVLSLVEYDIHAVNGHSLLIYSLISLLILAAGILLPHPLVWLVFPLIISVTLATLITLPLQMVDPRLLIIGVLFAQYIFAVLLTWMYVRSTSLRIKTLIDALAFEQELLQQKDAFINIASHELRTPLTALVLDCRLIERYIHQPERSDQVGALIGDTTTQLHHMDEMITTLLDASRISLNQFILKKEPCDLATCIREAVEEQERIFSRQVGLSGVDTPIPGMVDGRRIWQVVTHLVSNALKFSDTSAAVNVRVSVISRKSAQVLHVEVHDTGPGIPPQALPQLFARAYHARDANEEQQAGLGLGLYMCSTIITLHGGTIWVDSIVGQGSTFSFEIPLNY